MNPVTVLAIVAHPDDECLLAGGTLAACAAEGHAVSVLSLTRGENGPNAVGAGVGPELLGETREAELQAAGRLLRAGEAACLRYPDGSLRWSDTAEVVDVLTHFILQRAPAVVITFGPEGLYWHPDHIAVHQTVTAAVAAVAARGEPPWLYYATWPSEHVAWLMHALAERGLHRHLWGLSPDDFGAPIENVTTVVDVMSFLPQKRAALNSYRSQFDPDHAFADLPEHLAGRFLGKEYFVLARSARHGTDWLAEALVAPGRGTGG